MQYTREEIEKMPAGKAMDALIGEAFGFRQRASWDGKSLFWALYSEELEWAWDVVKGLRIAGWYSQHTDLTLGSDTEWYSWHFLNNAPPGNESVSAQAATVPLAICRAALLTMLPAPPTSNPAPEAAQVAGGAAEEQLTPVEGPALDL